MFIKSDHKHKYIQSAYTIQEEEHADSKETLPLFLRTHDVKEQCIT